ncbi:unnamed protein product [Fusarium venenatum]|uniref:Uncharacterized protein n=1 Tax=Fusarium venenatum TaxID=56646 RepID=A0A2L2TDF6_9HYPO|nr:uncharacterized protein FVRRES_12273 [Fusarium venenatum]CEI39582.1 unnamed protein product [Fusarium venenatum]
MCWVNILSNHVLTPSRPRTCDPPDLHSSSRYDCLIHPCLVCLSTIPAEKWQAGQRSNATSWYQSCTVSSSLANLLADMPNWGLAFSLAWCQDDLTVSFEQLNMWRLQDQGVH